MNPNKNGGFTLVELMVVIALIVLVASLAIPASLRARVQSNQSATIGNLRTLSSSTEGFRSATNPPSYAANLNQMVTATPPYLDSTWLTNPRQGYNYSYVAAASGETFSTSATPNIQNISGVNSYCVDHTGVIRSYTAGGTIGGDTGCDTSGTPI